MKILVKLLVHWTWEYVTVFEARVWSTNYVWSINRSQ